MIITKLSSDNFVRDFINQEIAEDHYAFTRSYLQQKPETYNRFIIPMIQISSDISNEDLEIRENYEKRVIADINYAKHIKASRGRIYFKISSQADPKRVAEVILKTLPKSHEPVFAIEVEMFSSEEIR